MSLLIVLSVLSLTVMVSSVGWAELTDYRGPSDVDPAIDGAGFTICATADYAAYVLFTDTKVKSAIAQPGKCVVQMVDDADATYRIQVVGLDGSTPFTIGDDVVSGDGSEKVTTTGTMDSPDWTWSDD